MTGVVNVKTTISCGTASPMAGLLKQWIRAKQIRTGAMSIVNPNHLNPGSLRKSKGAGIVDRLQRFEGICFDMDGTLTVSNIDFGLMRRRVGVPRGDLFTVMESWSYEKAKTAVEAIAEVETEASQAMTANPKDLLQPGLLELFQYLKSQDCRVALITRNSALGAEAFFEPDKRILEWVASEWDIDTHSLLMVGDSKEDIEIGMYSGAVTCHFDEKGTQSLQDKHSDVCPSFSVSCLSELIAKLREINISGQDVSNISPPAHIQYLDSLVARECLPCPPWSFPGLAVAHGIQEAKNCIPGQLLHLGCGNGSFTKQIASMGVGCLGVDTDTDGVSARGIDSQAIKNWDEEQALPHGTLGEHHSKFDVVLWNANEARMASQSGLSLWQVKTALPEIKRVLKGGGYLALFFPVHKSIWDHKPDLIRLVKDLKDEGFEFIDTDGIEENETYWAITATKSEKSTDGFNSGRGNETSDSKLGL